MSKPSKKYPFVEEPRQPGFAVGKTRSLYLTMRDGVKIALDVTLPAGLDGKAPTILRQTRYHRRMNYKGLFKHPKVRGLLDQQQGSRQFFVTRGYAWVDICARGSGASSGWRPSPWSFEEIGDAREIVDWIVGQEWSNGAVGARGISYDGTAAEYLLYHHHPAVKAVAPRFALFDIYADIGMPGGIALDFFIKNWAQFNDALDRNRFDDVLRLILGFSRDGRKQLARSDHGGVADRIFASALRLRGPAARLIGASVRGVAPVDADDGTRVSAHMQERGRNLNVAQATETLEFRDDTNLSPNDPELTIDAFSPHSHIHQLRASGAATYHYSGWFDGAYQLSAIKRFHAYGNEKDQMILGPWEHSGRQNISPWETSRTPLFDHDAELLEFFDRHLIDGGEPAEENTRVRYYVMGAEVWKSAPTWPPPGVTHQDWFIGKSEGLTIDKQERRDGDVRILVTGRHGTGRASRWRSLLPMLSLTHYEGRSGPDIASFTSSQLAGDLEVVGHPIVDVKMSSTTNDPRLFVYLEDIAPDGSVHYVTEGLLRARHRRQKRDKPASHRDIPFRSFERADAQEVEPGERFKMTIDLLPTAYCFRAGHSIRIVLAGQDVDHFEAGPRGTHMIEARSVRLRLPVAP
jgi:putative CocE/NonD family hydrolase